MAMTAGSLMIAVPGQKKRFHPKIHIITFYHGKGPFFFLFLHKMQGGNHKPW